MNQEQNNWQIKSGAVWNYFSKTVTQSKKKTDASIPDEFPLNCFKNFVQKNGTLFFVTDDQNQFFLWPLSLNHHFFWRILHEMKLHYNKLISPGALVALIGYIVSGPVTFLIVHLVNAQSGWVSPAVFAGNHSNIQDLSFCFGFILIYAMLILCNPIFYYIGAVQTITFPPAMINAAKFFIIDSQTKFKISLEYETK